MTSHDQVKHQFSNISRGNKTRQVWTVNNCSSSMTFQVFTVRNRQVLLYVSESFSRMFLLFHYFINHIFLLSNFPPLLNFYARLTRLTIRLMDFTETIFFSMYKKNAC